MGLDIASHGFEEHPSEASVRLEATTLPELFEEAARAVAELMCTNPDGPLGPPVQLEVRARDREALLASFIDELVFLSETERRVWTRVDIERLTDTELGAVVRGVEPAALRAVVKAATLHDLCIAERAGGGFRATVVLDV